MSRSTVGDKNSGRRRRTAITTTASSGDLYGNVSSTAKLPGQEATQKKRSTKGFQDGSLKKMAVPTIEFVNRESDPLEARMYEPPSCRAWLIKAIKTFIASLIEPKSISDEASYIYQVRSLGLYLFHVILVFWVIYGTFDFENNYHSIIVSDLITDSYFESNFISKSIKFRDIRTPEEIWDFVRGVILKIIYPPEAIHDTISIFEDSVLIGVAQLRQVRVKKDVNCKSAPLFRDLFKHCYGYISEGDSEDKEPFGPNSSTPWRYSINEEKQTKGHFHEFTGNGYAFNFSLDYKETLNGLNDLESHGWIRLGTRAVFIDFSMYNANTNTFLQVKIIFELMPWGSVIPSLNTYTIKLLTSLNDGDAFLHLGAHLVLLVYTIGLNSVVILRLKRTGWESLLTFNNLIDVAIVSSTYTMFIIHIAMAKYTDQSLEYLVNMVNYPAHPSFSILRSSFESYHTAATVLVLCMFLKFIRYAIFFNETARFMICAIKQVKGELICFTIANLSVLFGWGLIYSTIYGRANIQQKTPISSSIFLIYHYAKTHEIFEEIKIRVNAISFPLLVLRACMVPLTMFYISCISLQTYVALVVHGWHLARRDCVKDPLGIKANEMIWTEIAWILEKFGLYSWANRLEEHYIIAMNEDDYYLFTQILRRYGWNRLEIRIFLKHFGIRKGDDLTIEELFEAYQDFWVRNTLFFEVNAHDKLTTDLENTKKMVKYIDSTIEDMKHSIERLADQYLTSQADTPPPRASSKRRSTLLSRLRKK